MEAGQKIRDYILESLIGTGGVGEVWNARHTRLQRSVAIKVILPHLCKDQHIYGRFAQEAMAMANLEHPHIVGVHDFFNIGDNACLMMSYIDGGSLQDKLSGHGRLSVRESLLISRAILEALDFAHRRTVIHRDVKPSNILLGRDLHPYLTDFGIALVLGKTRVTRFGTNIGTPEYMSPEQIRGEELDHKTDVYSFGCVLYEMLAGVPPFGSMEDATEFTIMRRHIEDTPPPLRTLNTAVDEQTEAIVNRALAKDRNERFHGCAEMAKALSASPGTGATFSTTTPLQLPRPSSHGWKLAVAAAALLTLIAVIGWIKTYHEKTRLRSSRELDYSENRRLKDTVERLQQELTHPTSTADGLNGLAWSCPP